MRNNPIGIFDSGIGGLTVVKEIIKTLPHESIIYIGDTARVPYGPRSKEVVTKFAMEMVTFLLRRKIKALVIACNTISGLSYDEIRDAVYPIITLGVIRPAVRLAIQTTKNKKIGIIGTEGTIKSQSYQKMFEFYNSDARIISSACPLFVPMAEEGLNNHKATKLIAQDYLKEFIKNKVDTLILGCTHYPLLYDAIQETVGKEMTLIDSAQPTAQMLKERLEDVNLLSDNPNPKHEFYVTDAPERVKKVAGRFFGEELNGKLKKVNLED